MSTGLIICLVVSAVIGAVLAIWEDLPLKKKKKQAKKPTTDIIIQHRQIIRRSNRR